MVLYKSTYLYLFNCITLGLALSYSLSSTSSTYVMVYVLT